MVYHKDFFRCFAMMKLIRYTKVWLPFSKQAIWGKSGLNYATLYLMIGCKDFLKHFIMKKHKICTKVTLFNCRQKKIGEGWGVGKRQFG